jgi:hypothetical protein
MRGGGGNGTAVLTAEVIPTPRARPNTRAPARAPARVRRHLLQRLTPHPTPRVCLHTTQANTTARATLSSSPHAAQQAPARAYLRAQSYHRAARPSAQRGVRSQLIGSKFCSAVRPAKMSGQPSSGPDNGSRHGSITRPGQPGPGRLSSKLAPTDTGRLLMIPGRRRRQPAGAGQKSRSLSPRFRGARLSIQPAGPGPPARARPGPPARPSATDSGMPSTCRRNGGRTMPT